MLKIGGQRVPTPLIVLLVADFCLIGLGLLFAIGLRIGYFGFRSFVEYVDTWQTFRRMLVAMSICELALYFNDLYDFRLLRTPGEILVRLLQAFGVACLALAVCYYAWPQLEFGRGIAALAAPLIVALTLAWRLAKARAGYVGKLTRMLIMGTGPTGIALARYSRAPRNSTQSSGILG